MRLPSQVGPVVGFAAITATALLAAPAIASQLVSQFGLSPSEVGLYFTVEQTGMCLASLPAIWWLSRIPWRRVAAVAIGLFIIANLISAQITQFHWLLALRAVSSLSGGTLMVLSMTLAGRSAQRERLFAFWTFGQLVIGASLLYLLPRAFELFGLAFLYALLAVLMAGNILLLRQLPANVDARVATRDDTSGTDGARPAPGPVPPLVFGVAAVLLYYIGFGGLWPFLGAIAQSGGGSAIATGTVLALAGVAGSTGALLAAVRSRSEGWSTLVIGYAAHGVGLLALVHQPTLGRFALAACILKGASNFTLPFILGKTARLDHDGRLMGFTNMAIGGGLAIGPLVTGRIIESTGGFGALIAFALILILASALLLLSIGALLRKAGFGAAATAKPEPARPFSSRRYACPTSRNTTATTPPRLPH